MMTTRYIPTILLCATLGYQAAGSPDEDAIRATNLERNAAWFADIQAATATNTHWQTLPRILIDTRSPAVIFQAEATGLSPGEIVEFFLIGERSGNAYEAIAVAFAEPGDIAAAIESMGLPRGQHPDPAGLRFWPQGERVHLYFDQHHAADLMLDERTGQPAPREGFVFTASHTTLVKGTPELSAQVEPPFAIAANYNEPRTILDVPFQAPQSAVYSYQVQNPALHFAPGQLLTVRIVPERTDGSRRVRTMRLQVSSTASPSPHPSLGLRFSLIATAAPPQTLLEKEPLDRLLAQIAQMVSDRKDPFVEVHYDPDLSLLQAHRMAKLLETMESSNGIRILPPPPETLFYRAFNPNEQQRDRTDRITHPWELHLSQGKPPVLIEITETWTRGELRPAITTSEIPVPDITRLASIMHARRPDLHAVFVYAPRQMTVGALMTVIRHFQETHPLIHVFMTPPPHGRTSDATPATTSE